MKMLKRIGPKIDPFGIPGNKTWKALYVLFNLTFCFLPPINKKKTFFK